MSSATISVAASAHDASEEGPGTGFTATGVTVLAYSSATAGQWWYCGMLFVAPIPQGSTIVSATLTVKAYSIGFDDVRANVGLEDVDNADDFTTNADVTTRISSITTAGTTWEADSLGASDLVFNSPDISAPVQEVVDRPGWVAGNNMVVLFATDNQNPQKRLSMRAWDDATEPEPKLNVSWRTPTAVTGSLLLLGVG